MANMFSFFRPKADKEADQLKSENKTLLGLVQAYSDILQKHDRTTTSRFTGNSYICYADQVWQLNQMYNGKANWGCDTVRAIVDIRSAFIMGAGLHLVPTTEENIDSPEMKYIKEFVELNQLDGKLAIDWAREAEIEGKFLTKLSPYVKGSLKQVKALFISFTNSKYKVITNSSDYTDYQKVDYYVGGDNSKSFEPDVLMTDLRPPGAEKQTIPKGEFTFTRFGGRTDNINETSTRLHLLIDKIEYLAKALRDWREIDSLFSAPTPTFSCETPEEAEELNNRLTGTNWKIGKLLVIGNCEYSLVGPDIDGIESLIKEILTLCREISLGTGLPVHFLGYPDLLQGRDTADQIMELLFASTRIERACWANHYNNMFDDVLELSNRLYNTNFKTGIVKAEFPQSNSAALKEIISFWLTMFNSSAISRETLLKRVPGINAVQEAQRMQKLQDEDKLQHTNNAGSGLNQGQDNPNPTKENSGVKGADTKNKQKSGAK